MPACVKCGQMLWHGCRRCPGCNEPASASTDSFTTVTPTWESADMNTETTIGKIPVHLGNLSGFEGNAYSIMGAVRSSGRQMAQATGDARYEEKAAEIIETMMSGDYTNLLETVAKYCDDLDGSIAALVDQENFDLEVDNDD